MRDSTAAATWPTWEDEGRLEMVMRTVSSRPRDDDLAERDAGLDAGYLVNGHRAAAPSSEIASDVADPTGKRWVHEGAALADTLRLNRVARQAAGLAQRVEELETDLEQRGRRLQQVMGERDELRCLLARRDSELARLNREIGAVEVRAKPAAGHSPVWFAAAREVLYKLQRARSPSRAPEPTSLPPPRPEARTDQRRLVPWIKDRPPRDLLAVVAFGLSETETERVLQVVEHYCAEHEIAPLLLTDIHAFELFRNRRVLFEFLPARSDQERFAPELDWKLYTLRRLALIRRKWQPIRVVAFGRRAAEVVKLWHDSPFELTPIPAALNASFGGAELPLSAAQPSA